MHFPPHEMGRVKVWQLLVSLQFIEKASQAGKRK